MRRKAAEEAIRRAEEKMTAKAAARAKKAGVRRAYQPPTDRSHVIAIEQLPVEEEPAAASGACVFVFDCSPRKADEPWHHFSCRYHNTSTCCAGPSLTFVDMAWERRTGARGQAFYFNTITLVSQTNQPDVFPLVMAARAASLAEVKTVPPVVAEPVRVIREVPVAKAAPLATVTSHHESNMKSTHSAVLAALTQPPMAAAVSVPTPAPPEPAPLPVEPTWSVHLSKSRGVLYYFNRVTGITQASVLSACDVLAAQ